MPLAIDDHRSAQPQLPPFTGGLRSLAFLVVILLMTTALFAPSLHYAFLNWDDNEHVLGHPNIRQGLTARDVTEIFQDTSLNAYFPLTTLSFAFEYQLAGEDPFLYRLDNLLLHLGVICLIYLLALRLGLAGPGALVAALLFAVHPVHVESVVWITERKDVLYSFFYLLALNCYWVYARDKERRAYVMSIVFTLLSMLAKPMAVSLPFILLLIDWFDGRRFDRKLIVEKLPHALICLPLFAVTFLAHGRIPGAEGIQGALILIWTLTFYPVKFLFPYPLSPLYSLPEPIIWSNPSYTTALLIFAAVVVLTVYLRRSRWWVFALLYFLISIAIMLKIDAREASLVADRYMYLPSLGFCLFAGFLWDARMKERAGPLRRYIAWACLVFVLAWAIFASLRYIPVWKDSLSLWNYVIAQEAPRAIAFNNRGSLHFKNRDYIAALEDFNDALRQEPSHLNALFNRGLTLEALGRFQGARQDYNAALTLARRSNDKELIALLEKRINALGAE